MRIDNYVYTEQSLREAQRLLKPTGVLVVRFEGVHRADFDHACRVFPQT